MGVFSNSALSVLWGAAQTITAGWTITSAGSLKFNDNAILALGSDSDFQFSFNGSNMIITDGTNTLLTLTDSGTSGTLNIATIQSSSSLQIGTGVTTGNLLTFSKTSSFTFGGNINAISLDFETNYNGNLDETVTQKGIVIMNTDATPSGTNAYVAHGIHINNGGRALVPVAAGASAIAYGIKIDMPSASNAVAGTAESYGVYATGQAHNSTSAKMFGFVYEFYGGSTSNTTKERGFFAYHTTDTGNNSIDFYSLFDGQISDGVSPTKEGLWLDWDLGTSTATSGTVLRGIRIDMPTSTANQTGSAMFLTGWAANSKLYIMDQSQIINIDLDVWASGTINSIAYTTAETITGTVYGWHMNFQTNITIGAGTNLTGIYIAFAGLTDTTGISPFWTGMQIASSSIVANHASSNPFWFGIVLSTPTIQETSGAAEIYGIDISIGAVISGSPRVNGINISMVAGSTAIRINNGSTLGIGIDMGTSGWAVDEPTFKFVADAITTAGTVSHQIAIDIGGSTYYLVAYTHGT